MPVLILVCKFSLNIPSGPALLRKGTHLSDGDPVCIKNEGYFLKFRDYLLKPCIF